MPVGLIKGYVLIVIMFCIICHYDIDMQSLFAYNISKLGGKVMEVMAVMNWEVMNSCSNGSNEEVIALQNDHAVMKMAHGVMM